MCSDAEQETEAVPARVDDVAGRRVLGDDSSFGFEHEPANAPLTTSPAPSASLNMAAVGSPHARVDGESARGRASADDDVRSFFRIPTAYALTGTGSTCRRG